MTAIGELHSHGTSAQTGFIRRTGERSRRAEKPTFPPPTPGGAPIERGRAMSEEALIKLAGAKPPRKPRRLSNGQLTFGGRRTAGEVPAFLLARRVEGGTRRGASSAIYPRRPAAEREAAGVGVRRGRRPVAKKGAARMDRLGPTIPGVCAGKMEGTVSPAPAASGRRCGNLGFR